MSQVSVDHMDFSVMFPQYINHHPHYLISLSNTSANMVYDNTKLTPKNDQQTQQQEERTYPITTVNSNNNNTNNNNNININNNITTTSTSNCILTPKPRKLVCLSNESSFGTFNFSELFNNIITVNNNNNNNNNNLSQLNCNNEKIEDIYSRAPFINDSASTSNNCDIDDLCDEAETEIRGIFFNQFIKCQTRDQNEEDISSTSPFSDSCFYAIQRKLSAAPTCKSPYFFSAPPRVKNPLPQNFCNDS